MMDPGELSSAVRDRTLVPPRPEPPERDLPGPRLLMAMRANSLGAWPARSYTEMVVHRRFLNVDCFLVNDPQGARQILTEARARYDRTVSARRLLRPGAAGGLLDAEGDRAAALRRQMAPTFSPSGVEGWLPEMQAASNAMLRRLGDAGTANLASAFEDMALDAAGRTMFSIRLGRATRVRIRGLLRVYFSKSARATIWDFLARAEEDFGWATPGRTRFGRQWFAQVDAILAARGVRPADPSQATVMDRLFAADVEDTADARHKQVRGQVASLLAAGYETTARAMFWTAYLLSRDEEEQVRVRAELAAFPPAQVRSLADLKRWPRLKRCLLEALRLYPPASVLSRTALSTDEVAGTLVPKGSLVMISPWIMHRHKRLWAQPDVFRPERFAGREPPPYGEGAFMPFGAGQRSCLGAVYALSEAMVGLAGLFSRFEVRLDDDRPLMPVAIVSTVPSCEPRFQLLGPNHG